ncbi:MAG TPA: aldo/keto reductase [Jiangellaceae bacterium]
MTTPFAEPALELADGVRMPLLGFGTWRLAGRSATEAVGWALDAGYRHIDTATGYDNEPEVGKAVRASGLPREDLFITTKLPPDHVGRERRTMDESLAALGTDHVDLWLIHWPPGGEPGVSSWEQFVAAHEEGLARSIGVSNYSLDQIDTLTKATGVTPAVNQIKWSPLLYDAGLLQAHRERGVVVEGYSPFKAGTLRDPALVEIAARHGKEPAQVVVRWHIQHQVVVIPKSARRDRITGNADVFDFELSTDEIAAIDALGR